MQIRRPEELGTVILSVRRARGLNQAELAKRLGVSRVWLGQVERGKASLRLDLVLRVLNELQITLTASPGNAPRPALLPVGDHSTDIDDIADMGLKPPATKLPKSEIRRRT
jgi:HTH-type transcriptional regulator / antitoxin HipB